MSCNVHMGDIERSIYTVKEQMRAIYNTLPFKNIPARLTIEMAKSSVFWLNSLPPAHGVPEEVSPRMIMTSEKLDYSHHCKF